MKAIIFGRCTCMSTVRRVGGDRGATIKFSAERQIFIGWPIEKGRRLDQMIEEVALEGSIELVIHLPAGRATSDFQFCPGAQCERRLATFLDILSVVLPGNIRRQKWRIAESGSSGGRHSHVS